MIEQPCGFDDFVFDDKPLALCEILQSKKLAESHKYLLFYVFDFDFDDIDGILK